jgi:hypothetical protein
MTVSVRGLVRVSLSLLLCAFLVGEGVNSWSFSWFVKALTSGVRPLASLKPLESVEISAVCPCVCRCL